MAKWYSYGTLPLSDDELERLSSAYRACRWTWCDTNPNPPSSSDLRRCLAMLLSESEGDGRAWNFIQTGGLGLLKRSQVWIAKKLHDALTALEILA